MNIFFSRVEIDPASPEGLALAYRRALERKDETARSACLQGLTRLMGPLFRARGIKDRAEVERLLDEACITFRAVDAEMRPVLFASHLLRIMQEGGAKEQQIDCLMDTGQPYEGTGFRTFERQHTSNPERLAIELTPGGGNASSGKNKLSDNSNDTM